MIAQTNPTFTPFGFAGGLQDQDTRLVRFGARDYSPNIVRWISKDPIGFAGQDTNLYRYVGNNPIRYIDPQGFVRLPGDIGAQALPGSGNFIPPATPAGLFDEAQRTAERSELPGASGGQQDAFRHCVASCSVSSAYGDTVAGVLGGLNEVRGDLGGQGRFKLYLR